jgi:arylsulfatase A-like enzyme
MAAHLPSYPRPELDTDSTIDPAVLDRIEPVNLVPERFYLETYRLSALELEAMRDIYDQELRYLDSHVGDTVEFLKEESLLDEVVFILTSDHGENFGDHGLIEHQYCLYDTLIRVPLIIRIPSASGRARLQEPISTRRLFHWVRDEVASADLEVQQTVGVSTLTQAPDELPIIAEHANSVQILRDLLEGEDPDFDFKPFDSTWRSVQRGGYKYIWSSRGNHELYNVTADPDETTNLIRVRQKEASALADEISAWLDSLSDEPPPDTSLQPSVDHETEEALRALGYVR